MKRAIITVISIIYIFNLMAQTKIIQTAGRDALGEFAPEFAYLNDDILFGEVWSRNDLLSLRGRSLITITSLRVLPTVRLPTIFRRQRKTVLPERRRLR